jgi:hypothetical protein
MFQFNQEIDIQNDPNSTLGRILTKLRENRGKARVKTDRNKRFAALAAKTRNHSWQRLSQPLN